MALYASAILVGSFLLFQVQPLIGKYLLPWFGGTSSVWTTCMLFFQLLLVGGYAYAYVLTRYLRPSLQVAVHTVVLVLSLTFLPLAPRFVQVPDLTTFPTLQVLVVLAVTIGVPFLVLSANSPLLQSWFTVGMPGRPPYRLYAFSNAASLFAVASYPFLVDPFLTRTAQAKLWSLGMVCYAILCLAAAAHALRHARTCSTMAPPLAQEPPPPPASPPNGFTALAWLFLPGCSSLLLLAVTNKICQDIAGGPFLWLLPLCLYLISFVICFERPQWYVRKWIVPAILISLAAVGMVLFLKAYLSIQVQVTVFSLTLFLCCMGCHGELVQLRPGARHLTAFYLMIGLGGFLGGAFVAVVAPLLFSDYFEFQGGLLLCVSTMFAVFLGDRRSRLYRGRDRHAWAYLVSVLLLAALAFQQEATRFRANRRAVSRNFYGTLAVYEFGKNDPARDHLVLQHGLVIHGLQPRSSELRQAPTSYFGEQSGVGLLLRNFRTDTPRRIGVVGLGIGTLAAYGAPGDAFRFYEINPEVETMAREHFTYLAETHARVDIVVGDGRLCLARESVQEDFDILILDAFNSDAVPVHLLTRDAFTIYQRHLKPGGVIAVNISNRHLDLEPLIHTTAGSVGMRAEVVEHAPAAEQWWLKPSLWALLCANGDFFSTPAIADATSVPAEVQKPAALWTDEYAAVFPCLRHKVSLFSRYKRPARRRAAKQAS